MLYIFQRRKSEKQERSSIADMGDSSDDSESKDNATDSSSDQVYDQLEADQKVNVQQLGRLNIFSYMIIYYVRW